MHPITFEIPTHLVKFLGTGLGGIILILSLVMLIRRWRRQMVIRHDQQAKEEHEKFLQQIADMKNIHPFCVDGDGDPICPICGRWTRIRKRIPDDFRWLCTCQREYCGYTWIMKGKTETQTQEEVPNVKGYVIFAEQKSQTGLDGEWLVIEQTDRKLHAIRFHSFSPTLVSLPLHGDSAIRIVWHKYDPKRIQLEIDRLKSRIQSTSDPASIDKMQRVADQLAELLPTKNQLTNETKVYDVAFNRLPLDRVPHR